MIQAIVGFIGDLITLIFAPLLKSAGMMGTMWKIRCGSTSIPIVDWLGNIRYLLGDKLYGLIFVIAMMSIAMSIFKATIMLTRYIVDSKLFGSLTSMIGTSKLSFLSKFIK